jgi:hypothetical protein
MSRVLLCIYLHSTGGEHGKEDASAMRTVRRDGQFGVACEGPMGKAVVMGRLRMALEPFGERFCWARCWRLLKEVQLEDDTLMSYSTARGLAESLDQGASNVRCFILDAGSSDSAAMW